MTRMQRSRAALVACAVGSWLGCSEHVTEPAKQQQQTTDSMVVSDPVAQPLSGSVAFASRQVADLAGSVAAVAATDLSYVSLAVGSYPGGEIAVVTNTRTRSAILTRMRGGGLDPVAIEGEAGDVIDVVIRSSGGTTIGHFTREVPSRRKPTVVRTSPGRGKTDVPLNGSIVIVFSEPVEPTTVTRSSIRLVHNGADVAGTVRQLQGDGTEYAFTPSSPMTANTDYHIVVSQAVTDLSGDALASSTDAAFRTGTKIVGPVGSVLVSPDTVRMTTASRSYQMTAAVFDTAGTQIVDAPVTWSTDDPRGLSVSPNGRITANAEGQFQVMATSGAVIGGSTVIFTGGGPAASVALSPTPLSTSVGDVVTLTATARDASGLLLDREMTWTTSDPAIATVQETGPNLAERVGHVSGVGEGTAIITVTSGQASATTTVTVRPRRAVASVSIDKTSLSLLLGETQRVTATLADANGIPITDRPVTWVTDDPAIAVLAFSYANATSAAPMPITAMGVGTITITASAEGVSSHVTVTVSTISFSAVAAGVSHTCALDTGGALYCWGVMAEPLLPQTEFFRSYIPKRIEGAPQLAGVTSGDGFSCGLTSDGHAYCWGAGPLGNDATTSYTMTPVPVSGGLTFTSISAGAAHVCALTPEGKAYCWGDNAGLGTGVFDFDGSPVPVPVTGGLTFSSISAGSYYSCGVTTAGAAYCWGFNDSGQLGDGTTTSSASPVAVAGGLTFHSVSAGRDGVVGGSGDATCGVVTSGIVYCWGHRNHGSLGDGHDQIGVSSVPTPVVGNIIFSSVSGSGAESCGVSVASAAYCWGSNQGGELGANSASPYSTVPLAVKGEIAFAQVSVGGHHACGISTTGTVYCWGAYENLGTGQTSVSYSPVKVIGQR